MKSEKLIWTIVLVVLGVFLLNSLFSFGRGYGMGGMMGGYGGMMAFGWVFGLLILIALILLIIWLWKQIEKSDRKKR